MKKLRNYKVFYILIVVLIVLFMVSIFNYERSCLGKDEAIYYEDLNIKKAIVIDRILSEKLELLNDSEHIFKVFLLKQLLYLFG